MTNFINTIGALATTTKLPTSSDHSKLEQKFARKLKADLLTSLLSNLTNLETDTVKVVQTAEGIAIAVDTEEGFVTIILDPTIKTLEYDPFQEAEDYQADLKAKADKAEALAKAKAEKKAKDEAARKAKAEAKALAKAKAKA